MGKVYLTEEISEPNSPSSGRVVIYPDSDGKMKAKKSDGTVCELCNDSNTSNVYPLLYKNANYTLDDEDAAIVTYQTTDITITLPEASTLPNDGKGREFIVVNLSPAGSVTISCSGSDTLSNGLAAQEVPYRKSFRLAGAYPALGQGWVRVNEICAAIQLRYNTTWDRSNFSSFTAVPFNTSDIECDDNVFSWDDQTNPNRLTCNFTGMMKINLSCAIDSTGGSSYQVQWRMRKNGTTTLAGSEGTVGNYQTEDSHFSVPSIFTEVASGDYFELELDQNSLTGNANNIVLSAETRV